MKKASFYLFFFRSTLLISIAAAIAITFVIGSTFMQIVVAGSDPVLSVLSSVLKIWCTAGLAASLLYKETVRKNEYYFFYNVGISKIELIIVSLILYILSSVIIYILCSLIMKFI
ncbi:hypothetical protein GGR21_001457 [Dysgonomonas hofstadii]|uniref:Uncharacterized protein n=1 Tax=Dysgonomonas hofstadii TaxID=637886 RepID=A0A840CPR3_9BACT|nr:hypothetical protein [Dysgonomonas hofstadii]MBB4035564.1 hypothetical protein [Dysgonomonas hofstadii]